MFCCEGQKSLAHPASASSELGHPRSGDAGEGAGAGWAQHSAEDWGELPLGAAAVGQLQQKPSARAGLDRREESAVSRMRGLRGRRGLPRESGS